MGIMGIVRFGGHYEVLQQVRIACEIELYKLGSVFKLGCRDLRE